MNAIDFEPKTEKITVVYNAAGDEIARLKGAVMIKPKDYEDVLPVEYRHIAITTQVLNVVKIEKQNN